MHINSYKILDQKGFNTNSFSETITIEPQEYNLITVYVIASTGSNSNHVVTLQSSDDNIVFVNTTESILGAGHISKSKQTQPYLRLKVTTTEGSPSTCDVYIICTKI